MNKEIAQKYIQFAIDNWLIANIAWKYEKVLEIDIWEKQTYVSLQEKPWFTMSGTFNNIELITKKEFIQVISKWLDWKTWLWHLLHTRIKNITIGQAIAIRDWKLEEFINNLLNNNFT